MRILRLLKYEYIRLKRAKRNSFFVCLHHKRQAFGSRARPPQTAGPKVVHRHNVISAGNQIHKDFFFTTKSSPFRTAILYHGLSPATAPFTERVKKIV